MKNELAVSTRGLTKTFGNKEVIRNCTMSVEKGSIYGFLGKNGAGKTTVFKILAGLLKPSMGEGTVFGMDTVSQRSQILKEVGLLIDTPIFYEHLSASENLEIHLAYMGIDNEEVSNVRTKEDETKEAGMQGIKVRGEGKKRSVIKSKGKESVGIENAGIEETLAIVGLPKTGNQPVSTFSLGMRQRLAIARAMVHKPQLLILDEPVNGLDPMGIREMRELFQTLVKERGITILLSSHILSEIEHMADKIGIIEDGMVVKEVMMADVKRQHPKGLEDYFITMVSGGQYHV